MAVNANLEHEIDAFVVVSQSSRECESVTGQPLKASSV